MQRTQNAKHAKSMVGAEYSVQCTVYRILNYAIVQNNTIKDTVQTSAAWSDTGSIGGNSVFSRGTPAAVFTRTTSNGPGPAAIS